MDTGRLRLCRLERRHAHLRVGRRQLVADDPGRRLHRSPDGSGAPHLGPRAGDPLPGRVLLLRVQRSLPRLPHEHGIHLRRSHRLDVPQRRGLLGRHHRRGGLHRAGLHPVRVHTSGHRSEQFLQRSGPCLSGRVPRGACQNRRAVQHVLRLPVRLRGRQRGHHRADHHSHDEKERILPGTCGRGGSRGLHRGHVHPADHGSHSLPCGGFSGRQLLDGMRRRLSARRAVLRHAAHSGGHRGPASGGKRRAAGKPAPRARRAA